MNRARLTVNFAVVGATVLMLVALPGAPASAHSDTGTLGLEATPGTAPLTARVRALLEYSNDREVAPGATVTAEARNAAGRVVGPQPMADQDRGLYETTLTVPAAGVWTIVVTAANPAATAQATITVTDSPPVVITPTTEEVRASSDSAEASDANRSDTNPTGDDTDDGVSVVVIVGIMLVVGIAIGTAAAFARRRTPH